MRRWIASFFFVGLVGTLDAAPDPAAVREALRPFVDKGVVAGAVAWVETVGHPPARVALGQADLASGRAQREDDLFWIASMTKPLVGVAIFMLVDEGRLSVDDSLGKHLPEFRHPWVIREKRGDQEVRVGKAARPITLRDLLTHTSGLQGEPPALGRPLSLAELSLFYAQQPLASEPGEKWAYSNPGINVLGRVVEVVSGKPFAEFLDERLFRPLGMKDTTFWPDAAQAGRVATSYKIGEGGALEPTAVFLLRGQDISDRTRTPFPAGGLYSTAPDLARFYRMMLAGGEDEGRLYLRPESHRELTKTQTGELPTGFTPGMSWGYGFQVVKEPQGVTGMLSAGTYGHGGAYGTQSWADPATRTIYILLIQRAGLPNADGSELRHALQSATAPAGK
jgi:CubicO group peptidase (beta-lactamase class C family)